MGCGSCGSGGCAPAGCGDQGHCSSGGCNRLNVYDWLSGMTMPGEQPAFNIVELRFKGTRKEFYRNEDGLDLFNNEYIILEAGNSGYDIGQVSVKGELVRLQLKKKGIKEDDTSLKRILRKANQEELDKYFALKEKEPEVIYKSRELIQELKLDMKLSDVEYQADGGKIIFYYTAEDRVDFRELIKVLAETFKTRVEMRQIGARQEAGRIGGIGTCGRELCCSTWLTDFKSVTTSAARYQNLSLNPLKLAGQCGRLKCCLNYELDTYLDALKDLPTDCKFLMIQTGKLELVKTDIFRRIMYYSPAGPGDNTMIPLSPERVKAIKAMNDSGIHPDKAEDEYLLLALAEEEEDDDEPEFEAVIEGDLNRFDRKKKKKKKKKLGDGVATLPAKPVVVNPGSATNEFSSPQEARMRSEVDNRRGTPPPRKPDDRRPHDRKEAHRPQQPQGERRDGSQKPPLKESKQGNQSPNRPQQPQAERSERPQKPPFKDNRQQGDGRPQQPRQERGERQQQPSFKHPRPDGESKPQHPRLERSDRPQKPPFKQERQEGGTNPPSSSSEASGMKPNNEPKKAFDRNRKDQRFDNRRAPNRPNQTDKGSDKSPSGDA